MSVTNTVTDLRAILGMGEAAGSALISRDYTYYPWTTSVKGGYLQSAVSTNQAAFTLQNLSYDYEPGGNISSILDGVSGELSSFTYDALSRLTSMTVTAGASTTHSEAFTYDAGTGNLAGKGPDLQNLAVYGYDATHPHAAASLGSNAYTYDANGNQVTRSVAEGMFNLEYDAENHLVGMAPEGGLRMQMSTEPTESPIIESTATQTIESTVTETATPTETPSETAPAEQADAVGETPTETPVETPSEGATSTPEAAIETPTAEPTAELLDTVEPLDLTKIPLNLEETGEEQESLILGVESLESAIYIYDGDGTMVKAIINGIMTYYPGRHYNLSMDGETESIRPTRSSTTLPKCPESGAFGEGREGSLTIATRRDGVLKWVLGDHLGSTSLTANADGSFFSELRYSAFGEIRYSSGTTPTDYRYTGQLEQASIGLYYYVARWYDPELARFTQADTVIPNPREISNWDRYAYGLNNPIKYKDPSGHDSELIQEIIELINQATTYFESLGEGWQVLGDPTKKSIYTNGADLVLQQIKDGQIVRTLAVEIKNYTGNIDLGSLGLGKLGNYGGSIDRVIQSARRFADSSIEQLRLESQAILKAFETNTLSNALFAKAKNFSEGAKDVFNGVYSWAKNGTTTALKTLPALSNQVQSGARLLLQSIGGFMTKTLFPSICVPIIIFPTWFDSIPSKDKRIAT